MASSKSRRDFLFAWATYVKETNNGNDRRNGLVVRDSLENAVGLGVGGVTD